jgi:hypothetical protein
VGCGARHAGAAAPTVRAVTRQKSWRRAAFTDLHAKSSLSSGIKLFLSPKKIRFTLFASQRHIPAIPSRGGALAAGAVRAIVAFPIIPETLYGARRFHVA